MKLNPNSVRLCLISIGIMALINICIIYYAIKNRQTKLNLISKFEEVVKLKNNYKDFIQQSIRISQVSPGDVERSFPSLQKYKSDMPCFVVFIPSHACRACVSTFFSEVKKANINFDNFFLISEVDDQRLKRLWISYGYDMNKFVPDKYEIFKKSQIKEKIVIMKVQGNVWNCNFLLYELFLGEIFEDFIK